MALSKEVSYDYEIRGEYKFIQERAKTAVMEDGNELSSSYHRRVLVPDADVSGESSEVQAIASAVWTDAVKEAYEAKKAADAE